MRKHVWLWNHYATGMSVSLNGRHYSFAENLRQRGYNPVVFCANTFRSNHEPIPLGRSKWTRRLVGQVPFVFVKTMNARSNDMSRVLNMLSFYKNLFPVTKEYTEIHGKPDAIIASSVHPLTMIAGIQIAKRLRVPCICEVRDLWPEAIFAFGKVKETSFLGKTLVKGESWIYRNADAVIFTKQGD